MASAVTKVEATYQLPFLAHATMEPMNCTVHVRKRRLRSLGRHPGPRAGPGGRGRSAGLPLDKVVVHNHLIGGGFGRRLEATASLVLSRSPSTSTVPSRSCGRARKTSSTTCTGPCSSIGCPPASTQRECRSPGTIALPDRRWSRDALPPAFNNGLDPDTTEGAIDLVYDLPNLHVEYVRVEPPAFRPRSGAVSGRRTMSS